MFKYKVEYWDTDAKKKTTDIGLVGPKNWGKACKEVCEYYGESEIISIELTPYENVLYAEEIIEEMEDSLNQK